MTPFLDLSTIDIDLVVARRLAPALAHYYEAIPIAQEGNRVAVAMSHPENSTAVEILGQLLEAEVVALRTASSALRAALHTLFPDPVASDEVFAWLPASWRASWTAYLARLTDGPVTWLDREQVALEAFLALAKQVPQRLIVVGPCTVDEKNTLLRELRAPLWFAPGEPPPLHQFLLGLRGYASDEIGLNWAIHLLRKQGAPRPHVTLLPFTGRGPLGGLSYLSLPSSLQDHVHRCARRLQEFGLTPSLTLQPGEPCHQLAHALRRRTYDLAVVAAEGQGAFVGQLLANLNTSCTWPLGGVLIVKPTHEPT